jgi:5-methylcytosine-specific restriction endonuclease McrA
MDYQCIECGKRFQGYRAKGKVAKFCSLKCKGSWDSKNRVGENHPRWTGGEREKPCQHCGKLFTHKIITTFKKMKFCSKACADKGGFRYSGEQHPNYRPTARRKNRGGQHHKWVNAIISRDKATCQHCGATQVELHAHHIKSYRDHPELRFDVANGITLCYSCHWKVHTALNEKAVNSVNTRPAKAEGNTEPSLQGNLLEGVTTRGRVCRRWVGKCSYCGEVISKRLSDAKGKPHLYCNKVCMGKHRVTMVTFIEARKRRDAARR